MSYFESTKYYGHNLGLSCAFRQWRAIDSHCSFIHGYSLAFKVVFRCIDLDARNWCMDFGSLKPLKLYLVNTFDHKTVIARDDPFVSLFEQMHRLKVCDLLVLDDVGCEKFAELVYGAARDLLVNSGQGDRVQVVSVECQEHEANSATYYGDLAVWRPEVDEDE